MRLLIGLYLTLGVLLLCCAFVEAGLGVHELTAKTLDSRQHHRNGEEALMISLITLGMASLPLAGAYGLWRRWPWARLILIGISWWSIGVSLVIGAVAITNWTGLVKGSGLLGNEPIGETLAIAAATIAIYCWHYWVLTRPAVRDSFQKPA